MPPKFWKTISSTPILERRWLRVLQDRVVTGRGVEIDEFHVVESPDWVATVAITEAEELVLVRQYRHGLGGLSLELPAGVRDPGEEVVETGLRELKEETGYAPDGQPGVAFWSTRAEPARGRTQAHFVFVSGVKPLFELNLDATEDVEVLLWPISDLDALLASMQHAVHVGALLLAQRRGLLKRG